jgi:hypothetical protein
MSSNTKAPLFRHPSARCGHRSAQQSDGRRAQSRSISPREIWITLTGTDHPRGTILQATLGIALAFLGPGALSIDARLFGRKRLDI